MELAELSRCWYLRDLRLSLSGNWIKDVGGTALAAIPKPHDLRSLTMVLYDNHISDSSAGAYADLGSRNIIENLDLDLDDNRLGDGMARSLATAINRAPTIRTVRLSLELGVIRDDGARALSTIMYMPWVSSVDLSLRYNQKRTNRETRDPR